MKKLNYLICSLLTFSILVLIGCGSNDDYFFLENEITLKTTEGIVTEKGALKEVTTPSGLTVMADEGTLTKEAVITITEENFTGSGIKSMRNGAKQYVIYGKIPAANPYESDYPIYYVEKPFSVKIPNTIPERSEEYYIGLRENNNNNWRYSRINDNNGENNPQSISNSRASLDSNFFYFTTTRLNYQFALFGLKDDPDGENQITVVTAVTPAIFSADRKQEDSKPNEISITEGKYNENIKVAMIPEGRNISSLKAKDYVVELTYMTENGIKNIKLVKNGAIYDEPMKNAGAGNKYLHSITITAFDISNTGEISFILNTKGVTLDDFPQNFSVSLKSTEDNENILPFGYSSGIHFDSIEDVIPSAPINVLAGSSKVKFGDRISVSWSMPEEEKAENITYSVYMDNSENPETLVAEGLTERYWISAEDGEPLPVGSYSIKVIAENIAGKSPASEIVTVNVINTELSIPTFVELPEVFLKWKPIEITWSAVEDDSASITYNLWFCKDELTKSPTYADLPTNSISIPSDNLEEGIYQIKVEATNGNVSSVSDTSTIRIVNPLFDAPVIAPMQEAYQIPQQITISWSEVADPFEKQMNYNLWVCKDEFSPTPTCDVATNSYTLSTENMPTGTYYVKVEATNGDSAKESTPVSFLLTASLTAEINGEKTIVYGNYHKIQPEFNITIGGGNSFDRNAVLEAITVSGVDSSKVSREWVEDVLKITFTEELATDTAYSVAMNPVNDNYGFEIGTFGQHNFKTTSIRNGSGSGEDPFIMSSLQPEPDMIIASDVAPLIATLTADLTEFNEVFAGTAISETVTIAIPSEGNTRWNNLSAITNGNSLKVDIADNLWPAGREISANLVLSVSTASETIYIASTDKIFQTENGLTISLGSGTLESQYLVYTPGQLDDVRNRIMNVVEFKENHVDSEGNFNGTAEDLKAYQRFFKQLRDIDLKAYIAEKYTATGWIPIGDYALDIGQTSLYGIYDGNNRNINNLKITGISAMQYCCGLFGSSLGQIKNIKLNDCILDLSTTECAAQIGLGGLCGISMNIYSLLRLAEDSDYQAGFANCHIDNMELKLSCGSVILMSVGALTGMCDTKEFVDCSVNNLKTAITNSYVQFAGQLAGLIRVEKLSNCTTNGIFEAKDTVLMHIGGLCGGIHYLFESSDGEEVVKTVNVTSCHSEGSIKCENILPHSDDDNLHTIIGGLTGLLTDTDKRHPCVISKCDSNVNINLSDTEFIDSSISVGGLIGSADDIRANHSGDNDFIATIENCHSTGSITCNNLISSYQTISAGGLVGYICETKIENCYTSSDLTLSNINTELLPGGAIGAVYSYSESSSPLKLQISNTCATGKLDINNVGEPGCGLYGGGLIGITTEGTDIQKCYSKSDISYHNTPFGADIYLGGLVGDNSAKISKSYYQGEILCENIREGMLCIGGFTSSNISEISNCYADTEITVDDCDSGMRVGGFISDGSGYLNNVYAKGSISVSSIDNEIGALASRFFIFNGDDYIKNSFSSISGYTLFGTDENPEIRINCKDYASSIPEDEIWSDWDSSAWNLTPGEYPELK